MLDSFTRRHIGPNGAETAAMLKTVGVSSLDVLIKETVPPSIRLKRKLKVPVGDTEAAFLTQLKKTAAKN